MTELIEQVAQLKEQANLAEVFDTEKTQACSNIMQHMHKN